MGLSKIKSPFAIFGTPNELAEALSSNEEPTHADAIFAMREIRHVNQHLDAWFPSEERVRAHLPKIVWIAFTETLVADFEEIKRRLGLPQNITLPPDNVTSHRTPEGFSTELSALGRGNVERWYAEDARVVAFLQRIREAI